jgi:tetratricopeptide (TPR) repeat protein
MEDTLSHYAQKALPSGLSSVSLEYVRERLVSGEISSGTADRVVQQSLEALTKRYPKWAECWLELGHLKLDQGKLDEALTCYDRAAKGDEALSDIANQCLDPGAQAYTEIARIMLVRGRLEEAANAYAASLSIAPNQSIASIECGHVLRLLGRQDDALRRFAASIHYEESRWCVPNPGRNSTTMRFSALLLDPTDRVARQSSSVPSDEALV